MSEVVKNFAITLLTNHETVSMQTKSRLNLLLRELCKQRSSSMPGFMYPMFNEEEFQVQFANFFKFIHILDVELKSIIPTLPSNLDPSVETINNVLSAAKINNFICADIISVTYTLVLQRTAASFRHLSKLLLPTQVKRIKHNFKKLLLHCFGNKLISNSRPKTPLDNYNDIVGNDKIDPEILSQVNYSPCSCVYTTHLKIHCPDFLGLSSFKIPHSCILKWLKADDNLPDLKCRCCILKILLTNTVLDHFTIQLIIDYNLDIYEPRVAFTIAFLNQLRTPHETILDNIDSLLIRISHRAPADVVDADKKFSTILQTAIFNKMDCHLIYFQILKFVCIYLFNPRSYIGTYDPWLQLQDDYTLDSMYTNLVINLPLYKTCSTEDFAKALDIFFSNSNTILAQFGMVVFKRLATITHIFCLASDILGKMKHFFGPDHDVRQNVKSGVCVVFLAQLRPLTCANAHDIYKLSIPSEDEYVCLANRKVMSNIFCDMIKWSIDQCQIQCQHQCRHDTASLLE
jgi:hypothetical protein